MCVWEGGGEGGKDGERERNRDRDRERESIQSKKCTYLRIMKLTNS